MIKIDEMYVFTIVNDYRLKVKFVAVYNGHRPDRSEDGDDENKKLPKFHFSHMKKLPF